MKKSLILRRYALTIAASAMAAVAIDAAVNFDEYRQAFNKARGKTEVLTRSDDRPAVPAVVARIGGIVYALIFGER